MFPDDLPELGEDTPPTRDQALAAAARCLRRAEAEPGMDSADRLAAVASVWVEVAAVAHAVETDREG